MLNLFRHPRRVGRVLAVFFRLFFAPALRLPGSDKRPGPVRMRVAFEQLGGAWVKLGQMLALRYDLLPVAYCDELFGLLNKVAPFSYDDVRAIIRQELGGEPEAVFATFERQSFAAASIGQVHRATLHNGDRVAVKVQRPHIRETLQADIHLMYSVTWLLDFSRVFGGVKSREVIDEFARWTADELDYLVEARQAVLLHEHARGDRYERIARVYRDYTTSRVLTAELIEGIPLIEVMVAKRDGDQAYLARLRASGHDLDRICRHLDWNMLNQVFVFGYFHADLHPANIFVLEGDAIGYIDFGIVGQLPNRIRESLTRYSWLLFRGEIEPAVRELMRWLAPGPSTDIDDATPAADPAPPGVPVRSHGRSHPRDQGRAGSDRGEPREPDSKLAVDILETIRVQQLTMSPAIVGYLKMLVTLGALRHQLAVDYDLPDNVRRFVRRLARQQGLSWLDPRLIVDRLYAGTGRAQRAFDFLEFIEAQEPAILEAESALFGFRNKMQQREADAHPAGRRDPRGRGAALRRAGVPRRRPARGPARDADVVGAPRAADPAAAPDRRR